MDQQNNNPKFLAPVDYNQLDGVDYQDVVQTQQQAEVVPEQERTFDQFFSAGFSNLGMNTWEGLAREIKAKTSDKTNFNGLKDPRVLELPMADRARFASYISDANSAEEIPYILDNIKKRKNYEKYSQLGWGESGILNNISYVAGGLIGMFSAPENLIPIGAIGARAYKGVQAVKAGQAAGVTSLTATGALGGLSSTYLSGALTRTTTAPTDEEKENWMILGSVMGGVLGAGFGSAITARGGQALSQDIDNFYSSLHQLKKDEGGFVALPETENVLSPKTTQLISESGEVDYSGIKLKEPNTLVGKWVFNTVFDGILSKTEPVNRLFNSKFNITKIWAKDTFGTPLLFDNLPEGNLKTPAIHELQIGRHNDSIQWDTLLEKHYKTHLESEGGVLKRGQFTQEFHKLVHTGEPSAFKSVENFAKETQETIFNPKLKADQAKGLIDPEYKLKDGEYYFPKHYDRDAMLQNISAAEKDFTNAIHSYELNRITKRISQLEEAVKKEKIRVDQLKIKGVKANTPESEVAKELKTLQDYIKSPEFYQNSSKQGEEYVKDILMDKFSFRTTHDSGFINSSTRARNEAFNTPKLYRWLQKDDINGQFYRYSQDHHFNHLAIDRGWRDLPETIFKEHNQFQEELSNKIKEVETKKLMSVNSNEIAKLDKKLQNLAKSKIKLQKSYEASIEDLKGMWNRLRGQDYYGTGKSGWVRNSVRALKLAATTLVSPLLAIAQIPDLAVVLTQAGKSKLFNELSHIHTKYKDIPIKSKFSKDALVRAAIRVEGFDWQAFMRTDDTSDLIGATSGVGKYISKSEQVIYTVNLMRAFTNFQKHIGAEFAADDILRWSAKSDLSPQELNNLQRLGINEDLRKSFLNQVEQTGSINPTDWDPKVGIKFMSAVRERVVQHYVTEPHMGNKPAFFDNPLGMIFGHMKGFMMRAMETHVARPAQEMTAEQFSIMLGRIMGGTLAYYFRALSRKDSEDIDTSPQRLAYEGIMNSGVFSGGDFALRSLSLVARKAGIPELDPTYWAGISDSKINARLQRDIAPQLLFGTANAVTDQVDKTVRALKKFQKGQGGEDDWKALLAWVPVVNNPVLQKLTKELTRQ